MNRRTSSASSLLSYATRTALLGAAIVLAACSSSSTPSTDPGSSGSSGSGGVDAAAPAKTSCSELAVPAKATSKGSAGSSPPPAATGGTLAAGSYSLTESLGIGGPPPDAEAKVFKFTDKTYEVRKRVETGNTLVTYTESGTFTTNGTALELDATCSCTQLGTNEAGCKTESFPVTKFSYTATSKSLVVRSKDKGTGIEIQETFAGP